jgi:single-strand DNA-binding protein|tara:strand:- start:168 stop:578 length:411 start_codon:yes stop_codon:yes gene_type:complete
MTMNKMLVIGNAGTDPEMRYTPNGSAVTSFRLATNYRWTTSAGEQREETEWFTITAWNKLAETVNQYVTKGMKVYVEGRLKSSTYNTQDGESRFRNEINANDIRFLDRRGAGGSQEETAGGDTGEQSSGGVEDLPW